MIIIVDFGSQTSHLISRRIKEFGIPTQIITPDKSNIIKLQEPDGIILSGGPASVYEKGAPTLDPSIFSLGIPILGICYGFQLLSHLGGGKVVAGRKEYGPAAMQLNSKGVASNFGKKLPQKFTVWMSHGDEIIKLPVGMKPLATTPNMKFAIAGDIKKKIYGIQFHPEVEHTENGLEILRNFISICEIATGEHSISPAVLINTIKEKVGEASVIGAVSGGVDSTVAAVLTAKAIGKRFYPVFVDNGLQRFDTNEFVKKIFSHVGIDPIIVDCKEEILTLLKGISDPEKKRKAIGAHYIEVFEREMQRLLLKGIPVSYLMQGTIYSDVIESKGTTHAAKIKSHHNVGGLPKDMKLKLLEPLREFYKDEVRSLGEKLGLPKDFVAKQTFPGPGYAIRIRGEVTRDRLMQEEIADRILLEELKSAKVMEKIYMSFPIMTGAFSTAVKGDGRGFAEVVALRIVESKDVMTSTWARLPYDVLQKISSRIVNEVPNVSRVVFDITTKPPATMEWE